MTDPNDPTRVVGCALVALSAVLLCVLTPAVV